MSRGGVGPDDVLRQVEHGVGGGSNRRKQHARRRHVLDEEKKGALCVW